MSVFLYNLYLMLDSIIKGEYLFVEKFYTLIFIKKFLILIFYNSLVFIIIIYVVQV